MKKSAEGGLQAFEETLQQQTTKFQEMVDLAQKSMQKQIDEYRELLKEKKEKENPVIEAKIIDDGIWFNKGATDALLQTLEAMGTFVAELDKANKQ